MSNNQYIVICILQLLLPVSLLFRYQTAINVQQLDAAMLRSWWMCMYEKSGPIKNTEVVGSNW